MERSYKIIVSLLFLVVVSTVGNCLPLRNTRQSDETQENLEGGLNVTINLMNNRSISDIEKLKDIFGDFRQLIEYGEKVNCIDESYSNESGVNKTSSQTIQATSVLVNALLIDACEWIINILSVDLECSIDNLSKLVHPLASDMLLERNIVEDLPLDIIFDNSFETRLSNCQGSYL